MNDLNFPKYNGTNQSLYNEDPTITSYKLNVKCSEKDANMTYLHQKHILQAPWHSVIFGKLEILGFPT